MAWKSMTSKGLKGSNMSAPLHPEVQPKTETENQERELASYGGWQEPEVHQTQPPAQAKSAAPLPLLDDDDRVTPEQVQQERPWWMRPTPRMIVAGGAVMALLYVLFSLFGVWGGGSSAQNSPDTLSAMDPISTNQAVENRLKQLQSENESLKRAKLVGDPLPQTTAQPPKGKPVATKQAKPGSAAPRPIAIPPRPRAAVAPPPRPMDVSRSVTPSPPPRPLIRPASSFTPRYSPPQSRPAALTKPTATAKVEPKLSPQDQWLAAANRGHYVAAKGEDTADGSAAQPASYTRAEQPPSYPLADAGEAGTNQAAGYPTTGPDTASTDQASNYPSTGSDSSTSEQAASDPVATSGSSSTDQASSYPSTGSDSSTSTRSSRDIIPTYEPLQPQASTSVRQPQTSASLPPQSQSSTPGNSLLPNSNRLLDIGSTAEAVLADSIAWTSDGPEQNQNLNYLLRLESGFKNQLGIEILPKGTTLIAQVSGKADSGLFSMEVTAVIWGSNRQKIPVPQGALQVVAEDGSPLKAGLEKKGRRVLANAAAILAPGVERAMDSVANSAERLVLKEGDRSLIRSSNDDSNPVAAGISGLANGASKVVTERLEPPKTDTAVPYFKFPGGKTVRVYVSEDVQL